jgi:hypothetical protein
MPTKPRKTPRTAKPAADSTASVQALQRRVRRLERELAATRADAERRLEHVRRAANRRLAQMMQEIATLRHHEARAEALERLLAGRASQSPTEGTLDGEDSRLPG